MQNNNMDFFVETEIRTNSLLGRINTCRNDNIYLTQQEHC